MLGDVKDVVQPAEVAGEGYSKETCLLDHFKGTSARKIELWEDVEVL